VIRLRRRPEFVAVAGSGRRWVASAFVLQAGPRPQTAEGVPELGLGFTASRRIGKAVARNRARRRLREAARRILPGPAEPGFNYVIVARPAALTCPFDLLLQDLTTAFARVTRRRARPARAPDRGAPRSGS
jgi:ribonuclease P protein component